MARIVEDWRRARDDVDCFSFGYYVPGFMFVLERFLFIRLKRRDHSPRLAGLVFSFVYGFNTQRGNYYRCTTPAAPTARSNIVNGYRHMKTYMHNRMRG